jgi:hypothetical protein
MVFCATTAGALLVELVELAVLAGFGVQDTEKRTTIPVSIAVNRGVIRILPSNLE